MGVPGADAAVRTACVGPAGEVIVGGAFTSIGGVVANHVASWDGAAWNALGSGTNGTVHAVTFFDDGSGLALYAAGSFGSAGGVSASNIAKWDGATWAPLGSGLNGQAFALEVYDDGSGPRLAVGGAFTTAGGATMRRLAFWDGANWSSLGDVVGSSAAVSSLAVDGSTLYVGGEFLGIVIPSDNIVMYDGDNWSDLNGDITGGVVWSLEVAGDGLLYVGGEFSGAGGVAAASIAAWNGASWSALGSGVTDPAGIVRDMSWHDDGGGPALYVGGSFQSIGGLLAGRLAKWDGASWSAPIGGADNRVTSLASDGEGALIVGGFFESVDSTPASRVAKLDGCASGDRSPDLNGDGVVGSVDLALLLGSWGGPDADLDGDGVTDSRDLALLLGAWD